MKKLEGANRVRGLLTVVKHLNLIILKQLVYDNKDWMVRDDPID